MKPLQCLVLEDEPIAAEIIKDYIAQVPFLQFLSHCTGATEAAGLLRAQPIDVLFLDLHLPGLKGFDFLRALPRPPQVIVTTAYRDYALESYELGVVDYLMKPVEFSRFLKAVNKLELPTVAAQREPDLILHLKEGQRQVPVRASEILFLESQRDYVLFHLVGRQVKTKATLTSLEGQLPADEFLRIHRSFIVSVRRVTGYTPNQIEIEGSTLPIGRNYKQLALAQLQRLK